MIRPSGDSPTPNAEIFGQFLIESVTLSAVGVMVGLASGFAVSIGLLAGLYPSISASRLEPVDALRA